MSVASCGVVTPFWSRARGRSSTGSGSTSGEGLPMSAGALDGSSDYESRQKKWRRYGRRRSLPSW